MFTRLSSLLDQFKISQPTESPIYAHWTKSAGEAISAHTLDLSIRDTTLDVVLDSPTWAHQLLHEQQSALARMQSHGYHNLSELSIRVKMPNTAKKRAPPKKNSKPKDWTVSPEMRQLFECCAETSESPKLKSAYRKLSELDVSE